MARTLEEEKAISKVEHDGSWKRRSRFVLGCSIGMSY